MKKLSFLFLFLFAVRLLAVTQLADNFAVPLTTSTIGQLQMNSTPWIFEPGTTPASNKYAFFAGFAGNLTLTGYDVIGIGAGDFVDSVTTLNLAALTTGKQDIAIGGAEFSALTVGSQDISLGFNNMPKSVGINAGYNWLIGIGNLKNSTATSNQYNYIIAHNFAAAETTSATQNNYGISDLPFSIATGSVNNNSFLGDQSAQDCTSSVYSVYIGNYAGSELTGNLLYNTLVGALAGEGLGGQSSTVTGATSLGYQTLSDQGGTGYDISGDLALGAYAGAYLVNTSGGGEFHVAVYGTSVTPPANVADQEAAELMWGTSTGVASSSALTINAVVSLYGLTETGSTYSGTVTLSSGSGTITSSAIATTSVVVLSRVTASGTATAPLTTVSAGSCAVVGAATDNGTYNWRLIK